MKIKYYICETCGNIIGKIKDSGVPVICCGKPMKELVPNTTDAATEKHLPVIEKDGDKVTVTISSVAHPMIPEHYIEWVSIETKNGRQIKKLSPGDEPKVTFALINDEIIAAYAYCNIHGLWMTEA